MKKSLKFAIATFACASAIFAGCSSKSGGGSAAGSKGGDFKVEVIAKGFQHDFWKAVNKGASKAADELGAKITFVGPQNETAIAEQLEQLNKLKAKIFQLSGLTQGYLVHQKELLKQQLQLTTTLPEETLQKTYSNY